MTRPRKKLNLQCGFCPKRYTKREHLQVPIPIILEKHANDGRDTSEFVCNKLILLEYS